MSDCMDVYSPKIDQWIFKRRNFDCNASFTEENK